MTRAVLPQMRRQRAGLLITVSSTAEIVGLPFCSAYAAAKCLGAGWANGLMALAQGGKQPNEWTGLQLADEIFLLARPASKPTLNDVAAPAKSSLSEQEFPVSMSDFGQTFGRSTEGHGHIIHWRL